VTANSRTDGPTKKEEGLSRLPRRPVARLERLLADFDYLDNVFVITMASEEKNKEEKKRQRTERLGMMVS